MYTNDVSGIFLSQKAIIALKLVLWMIHMVHNCPAQRLPVMDPLPNGGRFLVDKLPVDDGLGMPGTWGQWLHSLLIVINSLKPDQEKAEWLTWCTHFSPSFISLNRLRTFGVLTVSRAMA